MKRILAMLFVVVSAWAQSVVTVNEAPLPVVSGVSATYQNGTKGATTYWYWVIAKFAIGNATPSNPFAVASITSGVGTVAVTWQAPSVSLPNYTLTYVVLRTTSNQFPSNGTCSNCLVNGAVTGTSVTDNLGSLASYSLNTYVTPKGYNVSVDNVTTDIARLNAIALNGTPTIPLGMNSGTVIPSYCNPGEQFFKSNATAGSNIYVCSSSNVYTQSGGGGASYTSVTDGSPITWALASSFVVNGTVTLAHATATRVLNLTAPVSGGFYTLIIKQDSTGGAAMTLGSGCTWKVGGSGSGAITLTSAANAIDILAVTYDGTNCYANFQTNFN